MRWTPPDAINESFVPWTSSSVAAVELDGEAVLYDEASGALHVLNPSATLLWFCFDGSGTLGEIADDVAEAVGVGRDQVAQDVIAVAQQLGREGLLEGLTSERPPQAKEDEGSLESVSDPRPLPDPPKR